MILGLLPYGSGLLCTLDINCKYDNDNWNAFEQYPDIILEKNRVKFLCQSMYNKIFNKLKFLRNTSSKVSWVTVYNPVDKIDRSGILRRTDDSYDSGSGSGSDSGEWDEYDDSSDDK